MKKKKKFKLSESFGDCWQINLATTKKRVLLNDGTAC